MMKPASSASGTSAARPSFTTPTVPRCSPEATPASRAPPLPPPARPPLPPGGAAGDPLGRAGVREDHPRGCVRQERDGRQHVPELLQQDHELEAADPLPAVLLGDEDAGPAEL